MVLYTLGYRGTPLTRLQRTVAKVGRTVRPSLFVKNPGAIRPGIDLQGQPKEVAAKEHLELLEVLPMSNLIAYSDGSQDGERTGWGAVTYHDARATTAKGRLPNAEVYDAEAVGGLEAMKLAQARAAENSEIKVILLFLDNSAVKDGILRNPPESSRGAHMRMHNIALKLQPHITIRAAWVPRHHA